MFQRIKQSYLKEIQDYQRCPQVYKNSGLWSYSDKPWENLEERLKTFGSNDMGHGISLTRCDQPKEFVEKESALYVNLTNSNPKTLDFTQQFGLHGYTFPYTYKEESGEIFVHPTSPRMATYANKITELSKNNVVEIGGGFGGVYYYLAKTDFKGTYVNFDLPAISIMAKYFLTQMFPNKKFLFYGEDSLKNFRKYDVVIMPHYAIVDMPKNSCDLVLNAHSLPEMGTAQIMEYLKQIDRISTKYFLHFNHEDQSYLVGQETLGVDTNNLISLSDKQFRPTGWKRIGKWLETTSGSEALPYYEYLYEKNP